VIHVLSLQSTYELSNCYTWGKPNTSQLGYRARNHNTTNKWKGYERNMWERREGNRDIKRIKHKKELVLDYRTMKIQSLQFFEIRNYKHNDTASHPRKLELSMTQWPWISHIIAVTTTTTNNISVAVSTNECCCFCISPQLHPNFNMLQLLHILLQPATPKSLNVFSTNLYLCIVTVAYHEDFSYDDPLHTLKIRRNNLHCTFFLYRPEKLFILFQWPNSLKF
jgi:hypothetical protein